MLSERALKELKTNICSLCQTPYSEQDIVILNGTDEDTDLMRMRMEARVARLKADKKDKKVKKEMKEGASTSTSTLTSDKVITPSTSKVIKPGLIVKPTTVTSASLKREIITDVTSSDPNSKKIKKDYSIAKDPKATEVYKSIFTSHDSEKQQDRAHWVTYNPFYN